MYVDTKDLIIDLRLCVCMLLHACACVCLCGLDKQTERNNMMCRESEKDKITYQKKSLNDMPLCYNPDKHSVTLGECHLNSHRVTVKTLQ